MNKILLLFAVAGIFCSGCTRTGKTDGPYLGNGFRNGWADQRSVVIWTRLTKTPELHRDGHDFMEVTPDQHRTLRQQKDEALILKAQIPEGFSLEDMEGACPGAPGEVNLLWHPMEIPEKLSETGWTRVDTSRNYTTQWKLNDLTPGTRYIVEIQARKDSKSAVSDRITGAFITPPDFSERKEINFCIITCHDYNRRDDSINGHIIYQTMLQLRPDFFVHTGDIEYYDNVEPYAMTESLMRFKWDRLFALPYQRNFFRQVTTYFMKDDHDALSNDSHRGMMYGAVPFERSIEIFDREQFPSNDVPYKTIRWGQDLQIWLMEGRNFRSPDNDPDGPGKTIWGQQQKEWVFRTMAESDATWKLLISPTPILGPHRGSKSDNHSNEGFTFEGDQIREFISRYDNIIICNGDRHHQYVSHVEGSPLWEFGTGPSSDKHASGLNTMMPEQRYLRIGGGFLKGSVRSEAGQVFLKLSHCDVSGNLMHEEIFSRSIE